MPDQDDSDAIPLDGEAELTPDERLAFRKMVRDQERARWAMRRLRVWVPIIGSAIYGLFHAIDWAIKHLTIKP